MQNIVIVSLLLVGLGQVQDGCAQENTNPLGLQTVEGKTYWVGDKQEVTYSEALASCLRYGLELVNINNKEKEAVVRELIQKSAKPNKTFWTSGNRLNDHSVWVWSRGIPITYFNWKKGEPNNSGKEEYCLQYTDGQYNDLACNKKIYFICERAVTCKSPCVVPTPNCDNEE